MARSKKSRARRLSYVDHREEAKHGKAAAAATNNNADDDKESDDGEVVSLQDQTHMCFAYVVAASQGPSVRLRRRQPPQRKL